MLPSFSRKILWKQSRPPTAALGSQYNQFTGHWEKVINCLEARVTKESRQPGFCWGKSRLPNLLKCFERGDKMICKGETVGVISLNNQNLLIEGIHKRLRKVRNLGMKENFPLSIKKQLWKSGHQKLDFLQEERFKCCCLPLFVIIVHVYWVRSPVRNQLSLVNLKYSFANEM